MDDDAVRVRVASRDPFALAEVKALAEAISVVPGVDGVNVDLLQGTQFPTGNTFGLSDGIFAIYLLQPAATVLIEALEKAALAWALKRAKRMKKLRRQKTVVKIYGPDGTVLKAIEVELQH
jgi:hypothetical protein